MKLRKYQQEAIDSIIEAWDEGKLNVVCAQATGLGKTHVGIGVLQQNLKPGERALWLAHRTILVDQPLERMGDFDVGVVQARRNDTDKPMIVGSVQTLCRENRMQQLLADGPIDYLVTDECHHSPADSYQRIYQWLREANPALKHLGLTATPWRGDGKFTDKVFQSMPKGAQKNIRWGIRNKWLVPPDGLQIETEVNLSGVKVTGGDFAVGELADVLDAADWHEKVVEAYLENCVEPFGEKKLEVPEGARCLTSLAFTPDVATSKRLAEEFQSYGINAVHVDGTTPLKKRRPIERAFRNREITVATNCAVYSEGADFPSAECILMARPTQSHGLFTQIIGRGLRPYPGKTKCLVLLFVTTGASILTLFDLGKSKELAKAEKAAEELGVPGISKPMPLFDDRLINGMGTQASVVSLFGASRAAWHRDGSIFSLGLGDQGDPLCERRLVILPPTNGSVDWVLLALGRQVEYTLVNGRRKRKSKSGWKVYEKASSPAIEDVMDVAAEIIQRRALSILTDKKKGWRKEKATPAQVKSWPWKRWGVPHPERYSKGQLAKMITHGTSMDLLRANGYL